MDIYDDDEIPYIILPEGIIEFKDKPTPETLNPQLNYDFTTIQRIKERLYLRGILRDLKQTCRERRSKRLGV